MVMSEFHLRKIDLDLKEKRKSVNSFLKKVCETNFRLMEEENSEVLQLCVFLPCCPIL